MSSQPVARAVPLEPSERPINYSQWTAEDRRKILRELLAHEDKLTSERTQNLYTLQGLLFATLGLVVQNGFPSAWGLELILALVAATGVVTAFLYFRQSGFNKKAVEQLTDAWRKIEREHAHLDPPPIIGFECMRSRNSVGVWANPRNSVPFIFALFWLVVLAVILLPS